MPWSDEGLSPYRGTESTLPLSLLQSEADLIMLTESPPAASHRDTIEAPTEPTIVDRDSPAAQGGASAMQLAQRMVLPVQGMTCASCVAHVEKALAQVPGVRKVAVNLATESAAVEGAGLDAALLLGAVGGAGYSVPTQRLRFAVQGMTCASCVARIEQALAGVPGVLKATVNLGTETASVELVSGAASVRDLLAAIQQAGYQATPIVDARQGEAAVRDTAAGLRRDALVAIALAVPLLLGSHLALVGIDWMMPAWMQWLLATPVQFWCARRFYVAAARAVRARTGNMDLLVSLGTLAAYGLSLYLWMDGVRAHGARSHAAPLLRGSRRRDRAGAARQVARGAGQAADVGGDPPARRTAARQGARAALRRRGRRADRRRQARRRRDRPRRRPCPGRRPDSRGGRAASTSRC